MMSILRYVLHFIKTWFLPVPAHDDSRFAGPELETPDAPAPAAAAAALPAAEVSEPEQDFHTHVNDEPSQADYGEPQQQAVDPDYPEAVPMHPVEEPEGADQRASRSPSAVNPFSAE